MKRRSFLKCAVVAGSLLYGWPSTLACARSRAVHQLTLGEMRLALAQERLTAAVLLQASQERIALYEPKLHAIIELVSNPKPNPRKGPLSGIPILVKDNIAAGDGLSNGAGSLALAQSRPSFSAPIIDRLRSAGATILGKTNMSEWANFRGTDSCAGWSGRGGQCRNPHALDRSPGGSSSGSAAAVAAGFVPAALATETNGSIVGPASLCGVVGLKPTVGTLSSEGIIPGAASFDAAGPIARTVQDVADLYAVLTGSDISSLDSLALKGARLGVARSQFGYDHHVDELMEAQLKTLSKLGAVIVDPVTIPDWKDFGALTGEVMLYELKDGLNRYLQQLGPDAPVKSLAEVIAFNLSHPEEMLATFSQDVLLQALQKGPLSEHAYLESLATVLRLTRDEGLDKTLRENRLDAVVAPTIGPAWTIDHLSGDHVKGAASSPAAIAGYPHITVPAGTVKDLPVGLSLYAGPHQEARILNLAFAYEQNTLARVEPQFRESTSP